MWCVVYVEIVSGAAADGAARTAEPSGHSRLRLLLRRRSRRTAGFNFANFRTVFISLLGFNSTTSDSLQFKDSTF